MEAAQISEVSDEDLFGRLPRTRITHDNKALYRGWLQQRLLLNRCDDCGRWHNPPKPLCPDCWSTKITPTPVSGRGTLHLLIKLHQGLPADGVDYGAGPHPVATVELEEQPGLRYTSTLIGCELSQMRLDMPVELTWIHREGAPFPVFQPAETS
jgi:uncharacterized OB-fold protein